MTFRKSVKYGLCFTYFSRMNVHFDIFSLKGLNFLVKLSFSTSCPSSAIKPTTLAVSQKKKQISFQLPTNISPLIKSAER